MITLSETFDELNKLYEEVQRQTLKKDIIYSLLVDGEHDNHGGEDNITGIRIMNDDATGGLGNIWVNDQPIGYLITNFVDAYTLVRLLLIESYANIPVQLVTLDVSNDFRWSSVRESV